MKDIPDDYGCSFGCESPGDGAADASGSAGYEGYFSSSLMCVVLESGSPWCHPDHLKTPPPLILREPQHERPRAPPTLVMQRSHQGRGDKTPPSPRESWVVRKYLLAGMAYEPRVVGSVGEDLGAVSWL